MQAIETRYLGPTNFRGARIKATCQAGSVTVAYAYESGGSDAAHDIAARAMIENKGWFGVWVRGHKADGTGCVYVCLRRHRDGVDLRTPHPQACEYLDLLVVRAPEKVRS